MPGFAMRALFGLMPRIRELHVVADRIPAEQDLVRMQHSRKPTSVASTGSQSFEVLAVPFELVGVEARKEGWLWPNPWLCDSEIQRPRACRMPLRCPAGSVASVASRASLCSPVADLRQIRRPHPLAGQAECLPDS